ncbi:unnamed protein product [Prorocentrum cordatum]|uniref:Uncharacterized protein n=1 Tax=Prorocentrum cordatum TaxID=2364126 RepID=A0ABN9YDZ1_9DINO|nr:unnamed protein product [Polarella glacialis]
MAHIWLSRHSDCSRLQHVLHGSGPANKVTTKGALGVALGSARYATARKCDLCSIAASQELYVVRAFARRRAAAGEPRRLHPSVMYLGRQCCEALLKERSPFHFSVLQRSVRSLLHQREWRLEFQALVDQCPHDYQKKRLAEALAKILNGPGRAAKAPRPRRAEAQKLRRPRLAREDPRPLVTQALAEALRGKGLCIRQSSSVFTAVARAVGERQVAAFARNLEQHATSLPGAPPLCEEDTLVRLLGSLSCGAEVFELGPAGELTARAVLGAAGSGGPQHGTLSLAMVDNVFHATSKQLKNKHRQLLSAHFPDLFIQRPLPAPSRRRPPRGAAGAGAAQGEDGEDTDSPIWVDSADEQAAKPDGSDVAQPPEARAEGWDAVQPLELLSRAQEAMSIVEALKAEEPGAKPPPAKRKRLAETSLDKTSSKGIRDFLRHAEALETVLGTNLAEASHPEAKPGRELLGVRDRESSGEASTHEHLGFGVQVVRR